jgi:hypothetical protein
LERRASLPRETRDYVVRVTGLTVEAWKEMPIDNSALTFVPRLPCRSLPAFANVEQQQTQQTELERAKHLSAASEQPPNLDAAAQLASAPTPSQARENNHEHVRDARRVAQQSQSSKHASNREARHAVSQITREARVSSREARHQVSQITRDARVSSREARHQVSQITRDARASNREAKHETSHVAREARTSKHETAHNGRSGRERHRSA